MNLTAGELHTSCTRVPAYPEHRSISSGTQFQISWNRSTYKLELNRRCESIVRKLFSCLSLDDPLKAERVERWKGEKVKRWKGERVKR